MHLSRSIVKLTGTTELLHLDALQLIQTAAAAIPVLHQGPKEQESAQKQFMQHLADADAVPALMSIVQHEAQDWGLVAVNILSDLSNAGHDCWNLPTAHALVKPLIEVAQFAGTSQDGELVFQLCCDIFKIFH